MKKIILLFIALLFTIGLFGCTLQPSLQPLEKEGGEDKMQDISEEESQVRDDVEDNGDAPEGVEEVEEYRNLNTADDVFGAIDETLDYL